jgi:hypothetical protein
MNLPDFGIFARPDVMLEGMSMHRLQKSLSLTCGFVCVIVGALSRPAGAEDLPNVFDHALGQESYIDGVNVPDVGLLPPPGLCGACNWVQSFDGLTAHDGIDFLASANGSDVDAIGIGLSKDLGGTIASQSYFVSFYIAKYQDIPSIPLSGIPFSEFLELRIGGPTGTVIWNDTPTPQTNAEWVRWSGTYTPAPSDVGLPFVFRAIWNERARTSIAIDGPMTAVPVPEPGTFVICGLGCLLTVLSKSTHVKFRRCRNGHNGGCRGAEVDRVAAVILKM